MIDAPNRGGRDAHADDGARTTRTGSAQAMGWRLAFSWAALAWERAWAELWAPVALGALFLALAISGLLPSLGFWVHLSALALFALGVVALSARALRRIQAPSDLAARRRLERINNLDDRPLEALSDRPSDPSPQAQALWAEHRRRAAARLAALKIGAPSPRIAGRDPRGLRLLAFTALGAALLASGGQSGTRLAEAFVPRLIDAQAAARVAVDAWIAPPDYTGLAPIYLDRTGLREEHAAVGGADADAAATDGASAAADDADNADGSRTIAVPAGGVLTLRVANPPAEPLLRGPDGAETPFEAFGPDARKLETELRADGLYRLEVAGETAAEWRIALIPDRAPGVRVSEEPYTTPQLSLRLTYIAADDYGVERMTASFARIGGPDADAARLEVDLPAPGAARNGEALTSYRDFTSHPWAGGDVMMTLVAEDALGQTGESEPIRLTLPQRVFQHPVAQAIVDFRRQLAWDPTANREAVRDGLDAVAWAPERYDADPAVFLSLNAAVRRLDLDRSGRAPSDATIEAIIRQLWETALHIEDGGASLALERLRAAERALQEALERDAGMAELEQLMDELQQAMQDYMQAMAEQLQQMQERGEEPPMIDPETMPNTVTSQDLNDMMDQIREMMRNGMKDAAQQMLSQLQQMMENMRAGVQPQMSPEAREAMQMMQDLQDVMRGQQELLDRTFQQSQQGMQGQNGMSDLPSENQRQNRDGSGRMNGDAPSPDAQLQEALRRQLGDVMRRFGEMMGSIPEAFGNAEGEMRQSTDQLRDGRPGEAVGPQGRAMDQLRSAAEAAREAMMERFAQQPGMGQQMTGGEGGMEGVDPLGRRPSDTYRGAADGQVEVPTTSQMQRSREIRDELRRRAGDRNRPPVELDYFDRLLDQFR